MGEELRSKLESIVKLAGETSWIQSQRFNKDEIYVMRQFVLFLKDIRKERLAEVLTKGETYIPDMILRVDEKIKECNEAVDALKSRITDDMVENAFLQKKIDVLKNQLDYLISLNKKLKEFSLKKESTVKKVVFDGLYDDKEEKSDIMYYCLGDLMHKIAYDMHPVYYAVEIFGSSFFLDGNGQPVVGDLCGSKKEDFHPNLELIDRIYPIIENDGLVSELNDFVKLHDELGEKNKDISDLESKIDTLEQRKKYLEYLLSLKPSSLEKTEDVKTNEESIELVSTENANGEEKTEELLESDIKWFFETVFPSYYDRAREIEELERRDYQNKDRIVTLKRGIGKLFHLSEVKGLTMDSDWIRKRIENLKKVDEIKSKISSLLSNESKEYQIEQFIGQKNSSGLEINFENAVAKSLEEVELDLSSSLRSLPKMQEEAASLSDEVSSKFETLSPECKKLLEEDFDSWAKISRMCKRNINLRNLPSNHSNMKFLLDILKLVSEVLKQPEVLVDCKGLEYDEKNYERVKRWIRWDLESIDKEIQIEFDKAIIPEASTIISQTRSL